MQYSRRVVLNDAWHQGAIFITEFSSSKIILHHSHDDNNEVESGIGYGMIIFRNLMVPLGLLAEFKSRFLLWDGVKVTMKEPSGLIFQ